jgi:hypothetical protein
MTSREILKVASGITGWMTEDELAWLIEQASTRRTVIEIGSWKGRSTKALALSVQEVVYSVDHWLDGPPPADIKRREDSDWLEVTYRGSNAIKADFFRNLSDEIQSRKCVPTGLPSEKAAGRMREILGGRKVDMVFIDGGHEYPEVKRDIELWRPMLVDGGLLCGHDYPRLGVYTAVSELVPKHRYLHGTWIWYAAV